MKGIITDIKFKEEKNTNWGIMYVYTAIVNNTDVYFRVKDKNKLPFEEGKESEYTLKEVNFDGVIYHKINPVRKGSTNFDKALKREQSRYTTMGASYVKDLIIAGKIKIEDWHSETENLVRFMFELDNDIEK